jgi:hypothetical protein
LEELFHILQHSSRLHGQLRDDIVLLRTRLNEVDRNESLNLISHEVASRERTQLHKGILDIINRLEEPSLAPAIEPEKIWSNSRKWLAAAIVVLIIGLICFLYGALQADGHAHGELYLPVEEGKLELVQTLTGLRASWKTVVAGNFVGDQHEDIFCYDPQGGQEGQGLGAFYQSDGRGNLKLVQELTNMRPSWSIITPGNFDGQGHTDIHFYDTRLGKESRGLGETYANDGAGHLTLIGQTTNLGQGWDQILADNFNGDAADDILFFDSRAEKDGRAMFVIYRSNGSGGYGNFSKIISLPFSGRHLLSGRFDEDAIADLFFYSSTTEQGGTGLFYYADGSGKFFPRDTLTGLGTNWEGILAVNLDSDQQTELLFIGPKESGEKGIAQLVWSGDSSPAVRWVWYSGFTANQRLIVPGKYLDGYLSGLFCYGEAVMSR